MPPYKYHKCRNIYHNLACNPNAIRYKHFGTYVLSGGPLIYREDL